MGGGSYDRSSATRAAATYQSKPKEDIFARQLHQEMNPYGITLRESRDSEEHPNSVPIIFVMDVTGSMGKIPEHVIKHGMIHIMGTIIEHGIADPQVLFLAVGDHITDRGPLQVGQFESNDKDLNMWLERVWLESGGGGNGGESYSLAHYFVNNFVQTDAWDKRKQKGFLFTIGDEKFHENIPGSFIKSLMGNSEASSIISRDEIEKAKEKWHVYHIVPESPVGDALLQWRDVLGEACFHIKDYEKIPEVVSNTITNHPDNNVKKEDMKNQKGAPAAPKEVETVVPGEPKKDSDTTGKKVFL
jgi:hypothetical protein